MSPARTARSDADLLAATRRGDRDAYAELWRRHEASARTVARSHTTFDADDLVAEAFTRIYEAIGAGNGPRGAFRPYLFTTIRNLAASWGRAARETPLHTLDALEDPASGDVAALEALDRSLTAKAFRALPERWQEVLWYAEIERMPPAAIAPLLGMSANATAALAYRAREGLRQQWIRAHLSDAHLEPECGWTVDRLGAYQRGRLRPRDTSRLEAHLDACPRCPVVAAEAREVEQRLAFVLLPLAAGAAAAAAYTTWLGASGPVAPVATGVAVAGTAAGAAGEALAGAASGGSVVGGGSAAGSAAAATAGAGNTAAVGAGIGGALLVAATAVTLLVLPGLDSGTSTEVPDAVAAEAPVAAAEPAPTAATNVEPPPPEAASPPPVEPAAPEAGSAEPAAPDPGESPASVAPPLPVESAPTVDPAPPVEPEPPAVGPEVVAQAQGAQLTLSLTGTPGAVVELLADGEPFAAVTLDESGTARIELLAPANHKWTPGARYS